MSILTYDISHKSCHVTYHEKDKIIISNFVYKKIEMFERSARLARSIVDLLVQCMHAHMHNMHALHVVQWYDSVGCVPTRSWPRPSACCMLSCVVVAS